jgi:hypothetical protein
MRYLPPFDLTSDMLFALALCPTAPLRRSFPGVPFVSLRGRTPLLVWFSRVKSVCCYDATGERRCMGGPDVLLYNELNALALLPRAFFVPGIYATSELTIRIGRREGMPKQPALMSVRVGSNYIRSRMIHRGRRSFLRARLLGSGKALGKLLSQALPLRVWPARFPSGRHVRAVVRATPRAQIAYLQAGTLALETGWLPHRVRLLPLGLYFPDLRMQLPGTKPERPGHLARSAHF